MHSMTLVVFVKCVNQNKHMPKINKLEVNLMKKLLAIVLVLAACEANAQTDEEKVASKTFCKNCYTVTDPVTGDLIPKSQVNRITCDRTATGTGAFCGFVKRNVDRAAWNVRRQADMKIQRTVNRKVNEIIDKL